MLYLNVPYKDKEEAKEMFARWDGVEKKWYATNPKFYFRFSRWIEGNSVAQEKVYIAIADISCWKCKQNTPVYAFTVKSENIIDIIYKTKNMEEETGYDMAVIPIHHGIPKDIKTYLEKHTTCKETYSNTIKSSYFANVCEKCEALQGAFFVYEEFDSPFNGHYNKPTKFIEFDLAQDISINYEVGESMTTPAVKLFNENNIIKSDIKIYK